MSVGLSGSKVVMIDIGDISWSSEYFRLIFLNRIGFRELSLPIPIIIIIIISRQILITLLLTLPILIIITLERIVIPYSIEITPYLLPIPTTFSFSTTIYHTYSIGCIVLFTNRIKIMLDHVDMGCLA